MDRKKRATQSAEWLPHLTYNLEVIRPDAVTRWQKERSKPPGLEAPWAARLLSTTLLVPVLQHSVSTEMCQGRSLTLQGF
jgi:hypothetical protein